MKFNAKQKLGLCIPLFILIGFIHHYAVDMPYWDEWEYVGIIDKYYSGELTFQDLWAQHNEHRIFFPRIITLFNIIIFGWNVYVNMAFTVIFAICSAYLLYRIVSETEMENEKKYWLIFSVMWIIFSCNQANNWLWGFQVAFALAVYASLLSIYFLSMHEFNTKNTLMSALAAVVSIYSSANGLFVFPVGLLILFISAKKNVKQIVLWALLVGSAVAMYFVNFHFIDAHGGFSHNLKMLISHPDQFVLGFGTLLSRIVVNEEYINTILALLAVCWQTYLLLEYKRLGLFLSSSYTTLIGVGAYSLLCCLFIDFGRFTIGGLDAQRYIIFSLYFWVALLCQTYIILDKKRKLKSELIVILTIVSVLISAHGSLDVKNYANEQRMVLSQFKAQVLSGESVDVDLFATRIYPSRNRIQDMKILKKNNIRNFQFANSEFEPEFMKFDINYFVEGNEKCRWSVDSINIDADKIVEMRGWAYVIGENNQFNQYKLIAKNDKELYISTLKNSNRADLIEAFPNEMNLYHAGFMGWNKVYIENIESGDYDLFLGIENPSGKYMCPLDKKIHVP